MTPIPPSRIPDPSLVGCWVNPGQAVFGTEPIGHLSYRLAGGRVALWSTEIRPGYRVRIKRPPAPAITDVAAAANQEDSQAPHTS